MFSNFLVPFLPYAFTYILFYIRRHKTENSNKPYHCLTHVPLGIPLKQKTRIMQFHYNRMLYFITTKSNSLRVTT